MRATKQRVLAAFDSPGYRYNSMDQDVRRLAMLPDGKTSIVFETRDISKSLRAALNVVGGRVKIGFSLRHVLPPSGRRVIRSARSFS